ncbi:MAG: hypothetical protein ACU0A5_07945 [Salipiger marinus]|uniref:hypothetical protein n=1 Tax=Salipiger marinus TaxID=555512 RepID=UPI004058C35B
MTELSIEKLATMVADRAAALAEQTSALVIFADDPSAMRIALRVVEEGEQGVRFWLEQLRKAAGE